MEGTRIISALLPVAIALAAEATSVDAQTTEGHERYRGGFSTQPDMVRVSVENPNWAEVRVYVAVRGGYVPIGTAHRLTSTTFNVPSVLLSNRTSVMLLAHPVSESNNSVAARIRVTRGFAHWSLTDLPKPRLIGARA